MQKQINAVALWAEVHNLFWQGGGASAHRQPDQAGAHRRGENGELSTAWHANDCTERGHGSDSWLRS